MCILGAALFATLGFVTYHCMTAEQFIWAWLRSELLEPRQLRFESSNIYYEALKDSIEIRKKGAYKNMIQTLMTPFSLDSFPTIYKNETSLVRFTGRGLSCRTMIRNEPMNRAMILPR